MTFKESGFKTLALAAILCADISSRCFSEPSLIPKGAQSEEDYHMSGLSATFLIVKLQSQGILKSLVKVINREEDRRGITVQSRIVVQSHLRLSKYKGLLLVCSLTRLMQCDLSLCLQAVEGLQRGASHDTFVSAAGYIIGEYGHELKDVPASQQFKLLHQRFVAASSETKASDAQLFSSDIIDIQLLCQAFAASQLIHLESRWPAPAHYEAHIFYKWQERYEMKRSTSEMVGSLRLASLASAETKVQILYWQCESISVNFGEYWWSWSRKWWGPKSQSTIRCPCMQSFMLNSVG